MQAGRLKDREGDDILDWVFGQDHETETLDCDTDSDSEQNFKLKTNLLYCRYCKNSKVQLHLSMAYTN